MVKNEILSRSTRAFTEFQKNCSDTFIRTCVIFYVFPREKVFSPFFTISLFVRLHFMTLWKMEQVATSWHMMRCSFTNTKIVHPVAKYTQLQMQNGWKMKKEFFFLNYYRKCFLLLSLLFRDCLQHNSTSHLFAIVLWIYSTVEVMELLMVLTTLTLKGKRKWTKTRSWTK